MNVHSRLENVILVSYFHAGDNDGSDLLQLLRSGHSSHCGWTNNFCSEEFLTFPARSSAKFIEEFLLRVRAILLSITEFARDACETAADQQIIEDIRSSPSNKDTESCSTLVDTLTSSRMQVLIGNDVLNSASELSDWLLKDLQSGNVVEFPLLPASSATCRSHIAATVESITALLTRCTGRGTTLTADDTSGILNAILSPNDRNGPTRELGMSCSVRSLSQDELTARKAVKMSVLLAVCGWNPVQSTVASADISSKAKATSTPTSSASAPVSAVTGSSLGSFQCEWCGRSFSFKYLLSSPADPLFQHRAHCLWAHSTRATGAESQAQVPPGWQQCASSVISSSNQQSESQDSLRGSTSRRESGSGGAESVPGSGTKRVASREPSCGDAEQAYKKIKSVIDSAALPRLSLNGRLSI